MQLVTDKQLDKRLDKRLDKQLQSVHRTADRLWVGDGFPVRSLFAYPEMGKTISPFLLLDYAGPATFPPTSQRRGVGEHPHRGFETVTIVYEGEVEHRDSSGGGGIIGPGDVQWMTAASGLIHEEFHSPNFAQRGGPFEMVQLWVNLPAQSKMTAPRYQGITNDKIPTASLLDDRGTVRVIAGEFANQKGPAATFTPINLWDVRFTSDQPTVLAVPEGHTTLLVVLKGTVYVAGEPIKAAEFGLFDRAGQQISIDRAEGAIALLLSGEPIDEPIVGHGPFVMNNHQEIQQAIVDYQNGKMGAIS